MQSTTIADGRRVGDILHWEGVPPVYTFDDPDGNQFSIVEESR
jgi:lactoylglutathione lyase